MKLGPSVEERNGGFRAVCTFPGERGQPVNSVGPWRKTEELAREDADKLVAAFGEGGDPAVQIVKRELHKHHMTNNDEDAPNVSNAGPMDEATKRSEDGYSWPTSIEGPSQSSSTLGGYRAICTFPSNKAMTYDGARPRRPVSVKGPWRLGSNAGARAAAEGDAKALCDAYDAGGNDAMQAKKAELFKFAEEVAMAARKGRSSEAPLENIFVPSANSDEIEAHQMLDASGWPEELGPAPTWPVQIEGPGTTASSKFGYRCSCEFPNTKDALNEGARPRKGVPVRGPWRGGPDAYAAACADASSLCEAFDIGGHDLMRKRNSEFFKTAEAGKPETLALKPEGSSSTTIEEDVKRGTDFRGYRAKCTFHVKNTKGDGTYPVDVTSLWRRVRSQAEADAEQLLTAFDEGGISRANSRRMELRREADAGSPSRSAPAPSGELDEGALADRYGKGFNMLAGMGFAAGTGLGREGQGRTTPVEASGNPSAPGATLRVGLGFSSLGAGGSED